MSERLTSHSDDSEDDHDTAHEKPLEPSDAEEPVEHESMAIRRKKGFDGLFSGRKHADTKKREKVEAQTAAAEAAASVAADVRSRITSPSKHIPLKDATDPDQRVAVDPSASQPALKPVEQRTHFKTDVVEHRLTFASLVERFATSVDLRNPLRSQGLTATEATVRLGKHGPNVLTPPQRTPWYWRFVQCLGNLFNVLLAAAGVGYFVTYAINPVDYFENAYIGAILIGVAFINAGIEFYELQKIAAILASFNTLITTQAEVIRDGVLVTVLARYLVPGDVIVVRAGAKVAADVVLLSATDCKVDVSSLTGESDPTTRQPLPHGAGPDLEAIDAPNLLFNGAVVVSGESIGIVVKTGDATVLGQIAALTKLEKKRRSPLSSEIHRFCHTISVLATLTALVFFVFAVARGRNFNYALTFGIGILVAWIPQGLAVTVTMLLTIAGRRMQERSVLVKDLHGVETLGAITMLATDKTGTLTRNEMTVVNVFTNGMTWFAGPGGAKECPLGERPLKVDVSGVAQILHMAVTCTRATFDRTDVPIAERVALGDATESGMLRWAASKLVNIDKVGVLFEPLSVRLPKTQNLLSSQLFQLSALYPKVFEVPFSSESKSHITIHRKGHMQGGLTLHMKGAPEVIWSRCSTVWLEGKAVAISDHDRKKWTAAHAAMCAKGHRVLAYAMLQLSGAKYPDNWKFDREKNNFPTTDLTFLGLVSLEDPPKTGVRQAIGTMRLAGIKVVMVTGDHPLTAEAVATKVNIITSPAPTRLTHPADLPLGSPLRSSTQASSIIITGAVVPHLTNSDWLHVLLHDEIVFARTSPNQKLEIVTRGQALGHIIGVTGDGVNDAAALKKADLGIAMNKSGSDVSKEAAGMILLDDDFATIVRGILEGEGFPFFFMPTCARVTEVCIVFRRAPHLLELEKGDPITA
ncbi:hypothetical protein HKX48_000679 [Thoreauomyces humboldtii]|nr:hypothetical protein HKX48_000679 [Thoreauomyces humboldtii]